MRQVLELASLHCEFCFSRELLSEIEEKLDFYKANYKEKILFREFVTLSKFYSPTTSINFQPDPKDAFLLELAETCQADYLVTGDKKHLLPLENWKETKIILPWEFEQRVLKNLTPITN